MGGGYIGAGGGGRWRSSYCQDVGENGEGGGGGSSIGGTLVQCGGGGGREGGLGGTEQTKGDDKKQICLLHRNG